MLLYFIVNDEDDILKKISLNDLEVCLYYFIILV